MRCRNLPIASFLKKQNKGRIDIYFEGDSITRRWGATDYPKLLENWKQNFFGWNAGDFGWGGDTIQNILGRLQNGELDGVNPKIIVLLAGTNNVGNRPGDDAKADSISKGIKVILDLCRQKAPDATIILTAIFPRNDSMAAMPMINRINQNIAAFADGSKIRFLNINDKLEGKDGKLFEGMMNADKLHPTIKSYQIWADALQAYIHAAFRPPGPDRSIPAADGRSECKKTLKL